MSGMPQRPYAPVLERLKEAGLRPTRQRSARRIPKSSRLSPSSDGKITITICAPVACSRSASAASSRSRSGAERTCA